MHSRLNSRDYYVASSRRVVLVLMTLCTLYEYMYATLLSGALGLLPVFGGAMFLSASVAASMARTLLGQERKYLTHRMRIAMTVLNALMLLGALALLTLYPVWWTDKGVWITFAVVLAISVRTAVGKRLTARRMRRTIGAQAYWIMMLLAYLTPPAAMAWILAANLETASAWQLWIGFAAGTALEGYSLWRERDLLALDGVADDVEPETVARMAAELKQVNAYSAFQRVHLPVLMALQLTLVMVYTFIGLTAQQLMTCLLLAVGCTVVMREVSVFCLRRMKQPLTIQVLIFGLFLWLYGLFVFYRQLGQPLNLTLNYLSMALSVSGLTVSVTALAELERRMTDVAQFTLKKRMHGYAQMRAAGTELAILLGQAAALILLTLLCLPEGTRGFGTAAFRPLMIVPPLILLLCALISALRFPMNNRHFQKLARWLTLENDGVDNPALKQQLESVVVRRHKNRFVVRLLIRLIRPLYYHKVIGTENLAPYEEGSMILICNHGEIYGPVVANLYIPIAFRPWVISNMMEKDAIIEHMYEGTMVRQKWLPEKWKRPLLNLITPLLVWIFGSLEGIPVYRGQPRELMRTFRETINAMQAGDNILVFPENGEDHAPGEKGYAADGVGQLYTGFAMIAPMYWAKTHKRAVFVPIYASRRQRTLTIGEGIVYDPTANATEEKLRIVNELLSAMQGMAEGDNPTA